MSAARCAKLLRRHGSLLKSSLLLARRRQVGGGYGLAIEFPRKSGDSLQPHNPEVWNEPHQGPAKGNESARVITDPTTKEHPSA